MTNTHLCHMESLEGMPEMVRAWCECGWRGPVRNWREFAERELFRADVSGHEGRGSV